MRFNRSMPTPLPLRRILSQDEVTKKKKPATQIALTSSKTLDATFDEKGQVKQILQSGNFHYAEGARKAQADNAVMDNAKNLMDLDAHARIADDSGSTVAESHPTRSGHR